MFRDMHPQDRAALREWAELLAPIAVHLDREVDKTEIAIAASDCFPYSLGPRLTAILMEVIHYMAIIREGSMDEPDLTPAGIHAMMLATISEAQMIAMSLDHWTAPREEGAHAR